MNKIICGDTLKTLKTFSDESVDCVITSPPYWALRDYGIEGQLGLEPTFQEYITKLCDIFDEVKRVLKKSGTCWVNLGDTYWGSGRGPDEKFGIGRDEDNQPAGTNNPAKGSSYQDKCLLQIPYRFSIEMCNRGWILRNILIWYKRNCMPSSVRDRFTVDWEPIFFFVKNKKYWFERQFEPYPQSTLDRLKYPVADHNVSLDKRKDGWVTTKNRDERVKLEPNPQGRNKRCVWDITTQPFKGAHFAVFPEALVEPMMRAGCPEFVCDKCGKGREKIWEASKYQPEIVSDGIRFVDKSRRDKNRKLSGQDYNKFKQKNPDEFKGYTFCSCNTGFSGGVVLDCFGGSGTVGVVAKKLKRQYILIDLSPDYCEMARKRIANTQPPLF